MARHGRQPGRAGLTWRVALVCALLWVLASFARLAEDAQDELYYPDLHERLFCVATGPVLAADPWADEFGNWGDEGDEDDPESRDWNDLSRDANEERKKSWPHPVGPACISDLSPDALAPAPASHAVAELTPAPPAQRALLHLLQLLLI